MRAAALRKARARSPSTAKRPSTTSSAPPGLLELRCWYVALLQTCCAVVPKCRSEAWSPEKKHWCCTKQGKGCEGHSPPSVDAGYGMVWKHVQAAGIRQNSRAKSLCMVLQCAVVQVNGYWTWVAVHGHGHFSMPYDCHAGLANWHTGWSVGKKVPRGRCSMSVECHRSHEPLP